MQAQVRFYGALNDFLPAVRRRTTLVCSFTIRTSVKDIIESLGVPHPEVDRLVVNGELVTFAHGVGDGDRIAAYPPLYQLDLGEAGRLVPPLVGDLRFVADVHLGRLAAYLRLAGFDTQYHNEASDSDLAAISAREDRVLLTRDVGLLKRAVVTHGCYVRNTMPGRQMVEVLRRFDCVSSARPFTRCPRCNSLLESVDKERVADRVPPRTRGCVDLFWRCPTCEAVYWRGAHFDRITHFLDVTFAAAKR